MANLGVSIATAEIANPLGLRVVARYYESWLDNRIEDCAHIGVISMEGVGDFSF